MKVTKLIQKFDDSLAAVEKCLVVILYTVLILLIIFNILSRNFVNYSSQQLLEMLPVLVLWLVLIGSSLAIKNQRHIKIELLLRFCGQRVRFWANLAAGLFGMAVMGILFWASLDFTRNEIDIFGSWGWISLVFPLFFLISFFRFGTKIIHGTQNDFQNNQRSIGRL